MTRRRNIQHGKARQPPVGIVVPVIIVAVCSVTLGFLLGAILQAVI